MNKLDSEGVQQAINITDGFFGFMLLFMCFLGLFLFVNYPATVWIDLITDDAYFYLGVVRNLVEHGVSSYSPPFETNGYQPLWLLAQTGLAAMLGATETGLVVQNYFLSFVFVVFFIVLSRRRHGMAFPAIICTLSYVHITWSGMESVMIPPLFILFMASKSWQCRGIFGALLFLGRLDTLSIVVARDLYWRLSRKEADSRHYLIIAPIIICYGLLNYVMFGIPVPVSGLAKSIGSVFGENLDAGLVYLLTLKTVVRIMTFVLLVLVINKIRISELRFLDEIIVLSISCCFVVAYYVTRSGWGLWEWYYWAPFLLIYYSLMEAAFLIKVLLSCNGGVVKHASAAILALTILYTVKPCIGYLSERLALLNWPLPTSTLSTSFGRKNLELVEWIKQNKIPPKSFFAMGDRAGSFGYFLGNEYRFLHTEGLVGPIEYYRAMLADDGLSFVDKLNIDYWIADRENYMQNQEVIGVIEPVQGMSAHRGAYIVCFRKNGIVLDQSYINQENIASQKYESRYVFDMKSRVACPDEFKAKLAALKRLYGGVREFSLPVETARGLRFKNLLSRLTSVSP